jgi:hypothetical protein
MMMVVIIGQECRERIVVVVRISRREKGERREGTLYIPSRVYI